MHFPPAISARFSSLVAAAFLAVPAFGQLSARLEILPFEGIIRDLSADGSAITGELRPHQQAFAWTRQGGFVDLGIPADVQSSSGEDVTNGAAHVSGWLATEETNGRFAWAAGSGVLWPATEKIVSDDNRVEFENSGTFAIRRENGVETTLSGPPGTQSSRVSRVSSNGEAALATISTASVSAIPGLFRGAEFAALPELRMSQTSEISADGKWIVGNVVVSTDEYYQYLFNVEERSFTPFRFEPGETGNGIPYAGYVHDVSADGTRALGVSNGRPALWDREEGVREIPALLAALGDPWLQEHWYFSRPYMSDDGSVLAGAVYDDAAGWVPYLVHLDSVAVPEPGVYGLSATVVLIGAMLLRRRRCASPKPGPVRRRSDRLS